MAGPTKGRADYLALGDWNAVCFQCGRKRKAGELWKYWEGYYVCPQHWEPRQPQDFVRGVPDNQVPPWVQPMPEDSFVQFCTPCGIGAIAGQAVAGCAIAGFINPLCDETLGCTTSSSVAGIAIAGCALTGT